MVDLVRRGDPPPYARGARWVNWTEPGGMVWVFVWHRMTFLLILFGVCAGFAYGPIQGISYLLPAHKLSQSDVTQILGGQAVLDRTGAPVIDPTASNVSVYHVQDGRSPQLKYQSDAPKAGEPVTFILLIDGAASYQDLVTALDDLRGDRQDVEIWLAAR